MDLIFTRPGGLCSLRPYQKPVGSYVYQRPQSSGVYPSEGGGRFGDPLLPPVAFVSTLHLRQPVCWDQQGLTPEPLSEASSEGRPAVRLRAIASKRFLITEQWAQQTKINLEMHTTFFVINYQNSGSQFLHFLHTLTRKSLASKPLSSTCSPVCFEKGGEDQSAAFRTTETGDLH